VFGPVVNARKEVVGIDITICATLYR